MKNIITTVVGDFAVHMTYQPSVDDMILNRFTSVINQFATQPMLIVSNSHPELDTIKNSGELADLAVDLMDEDEAKIEKALYESTRTAEGAGVRVQFSLSKREIMLCNS